MDRRTKLLNLLRLRVLNADAARRACFNAHTPGILMKKRIRVGIFGDFHCGHNMGLTPPAYQYKIIPDATTTEHHRRNKWATWQVDAWHWFDEMLEIVKPIDYLIIPGDCIEGAGKRSGGTELITSDRKVQCYMAIEVIKRIDVRKMLLVFGTPYHCGADETFETNISQVFKAKIGTHEWLDVNGCIFDIKHHQTNTVNPMTSLLNEYNVNRKWAEAEEQPVANVILRAHTHRAFYARWQDCLLVSNPSLQGWSRYGTLMGRRKVDFGFTIIDVWPDGFPEIYMFTARKSDIVSQKVSVERI